MFCPSCGQKQITEDTRFCSRCGFLLAGVTELIYNGGALPQTLVAAGSKKKFYKKKGFKQGLFIFLLSFIIIPIIAILTVAANAEPYAVIIAAILLGVGGMLRMVYSLMFEADEPNQAALEQGNITASPNYLGRTKSANALPPQQSIPASGYIPPNPGNWRDTNDLGQPSVTDGTTKLLEREEEIK